MLLSAFIIESKSNFMFIHLLFCLSKLLISTHNVTYLRCGSICDYMKKIENYTTTTIKSKGMLKIFILDFGIIRPCLLWNIRCHVGTWCILHGLGYRKVNSFFINHFHFLGVMKFCRSYTTYMLGRNPFLIEF